MDQVPFRRKINFLVLVPALAVTVSMVPVVDSQASNANQWSSAAAYLSSTKPISQLLDDLSNERQLSFEVIGGDLADQATFNDAITTTDKQADKVRDAFHGNPPSAISTALAGIDELSFARYQASALAQETTAAAMGNPGNAASSEAEIASEENLITLSYGEVITDLVESMDLAGRAALGGPVAVPEAELDLLYETDLAENQREASLVAFAQDIEEQTSWQPVAAGNVPNLDDASNTNYAAQYFDTAIQQDAIATAQEQRFDLVAPAEDTTALNAVYNLPEQQLIDAYQNDMVNAFQPVFEQGTDSEMAALRGVGRSNNIVNDYEKLSIDRSKAEQEITTRIISSAQANATNADWTAAGLAGLALLLLIALLGLSIAIRRSILRPMLRLTRAASRVAQVAQTDLQRVADDDLADEEAAHRLEMVEVFSRDEIGDLARAFNQLQISAVQVLERQVAIRRNTAEMFGNMGRRIHNLTGRQLSLVDQVERAETDPVLLDLLYRIDHLAVRLQRGADSLMLLSGEQETDLGATPMRLTDVARSAIGRVEGYHRVVLSAEGDGLVEPAAIGDLTLLLSELVENAVTFSPAYSMVEVSVRRAVDAAILEIVDHGIGLAPYRIAEENEKLIHRERLDLAPTKVLGLFVVSRLARRTGVKVALFPTPDGGVTARVTVGEELMLSANAQLTTLPPRPPAVAVTTHTPSLPEPRGQSDQLHTRQLPARRRMALPPGPQASVQPAQSGPAPSAASTAEPISGLPRRSRSSARDEAAAGADNRPLNGSDLGRTAPRVAEPYQSSLTPELDAEAVRSAIEEFESGVEMALRNSADALHLPGFTPPAYTPPPYTTVPDADSVPFGASETTDEKGEQR